MHLRLRGAYALTVELLVLCGALKACIPGAMTASSLFLAVKQMYLCSNVCDHTTCLLTLLVLVLLLFADSLASCQCWINPLTVLLLNMPSTPGRNTTQQSMQVSRCTWCLGASKSSKATAVLYGVKVQFAPNWT